MSGTGVVANEKPGAGDERYQLAQIKAAQGDDARGHVARRFGFDCALAGTEQQDGS